MATRDLLVRAGFDASGMSKGTRQANNALRQFGQNANNQMRSLNSTINSIVGKIGKALAGVFAIGTIINFGKECIELGSSLSEVQNVVDVTFGSMAEDVNEFAKTAITQFGLSETSAKQYTSTMGAMLKSMGLTTSEALNMSKTITGLSADMASFYNLDPKVAFEKIRSGISGETEPLKQLGINMSVANMQAYAMSEGISKAYSKMTQQEQALLRYNYLLNVTADAQGDFARTSDSWANQTKILAEQFNALKAEIGQGLIVAFTPVIKALNFLVARLTIAAKYFRAFMELLFGKQSVSAGAGMADVTDSVGSVEDTADKASDAVEGVGDAAKKAGKKAKGALANFDELNQLNLSKDKDSDTGGAGGAMGDAVEVDFGQIDTSTNILSDKVTSMIDGIIQEFNRLKDIFKTGFEIGIGGDWKERLEEVQSFVPRIKESLKNIFDSDTAQAARNMFDAWVLSAGQTVGAWASVGITIMTNLVGGATKYLEQNGQYIKERLIGIFNVSEEIAVIWGEWVTTFADILSVFGGETAQQVTANILGMFANGFLGATELALKFGRDILDCITGPIIANKDKIKVALENTFKPLETITGMLKDLVTNTFKSILDAYDKYVAPAFQNIKEGLTQIVEALLDAYNTHIAPTIDKMANAWREFYDKHLQPVIDKAIDVLGKLVLASSELWNNCLAPFVAWCIDFMAPFIATAFEAISEAFRIAAEFITDTVSGLLGSFGGIIDYLRGVFKGDWELAWSGIKQYYKGMCDTLKAILIDPLKNGLEWLQNYFTTNWENSWEGCKKIFKGVFDSLVGIAKGPINLIIDAINTMIRGLNKFKIDIPDWVSDIPGLGKYGGQSIGFNIPTIPKLARGGIVDSATFMGNYIAGEAGKEMIVPLENTSFVNKLASSLGNAVMQAMQFTGPQSDYSNEPIVLEIDGKEIARVMARPLQREYNRLGVVMK